MSIDRKHSLVIPNLSDWLGLIMKWLGVVEVGRKISSTTTAIASRELLTRKEALRLLAGAVEAVRKPGQDGLELQRLCILVAVLQTYDAVLEKFKRWVEIENRLMELDKKFAIISRVVVHPKYRTISLGVKLVKQTMPLVGLPFIEAIAVMAQYNPFFEKAGMTKIVERFPSHNILDAIEKLRALGFNPMLLVSAEYNLETLKSMDSKEIKECREILTSVRNPRLKKFANSHAAYGRVEEYRKAVSKASLKKLAKMLKALSFLAQTKVYLLWKNRD